VATTTATPSTTTYQPGDVVLVAFPFTSGTAAKPRPALVLVDTGDQDALVARVTTQPYATRYDVPLADWQVAALLAPSVVRLHKLATLDRSLFGRRLGHISPDDSRRVAAVLRSMFGRWP
jgi:mRNA interferase MazF